MTEHMMPRLPESVVREDRQLEATAEKASEALAKLRWHWTLDESNDGRVSFRDYARQVGKHERTIRGYVQAYVRFTQSAVPGADSFDDYRRRALVGVERALATEAVAATEGITFRTAQDARQDTVREIKNAVENEAERRTEQGRDFAAEERAEYARRVAEMKKKTREREERERRERKQKHNAMFLEVDARLGKVRREAKEALDSIRDAELTEEEIDLLRRQSEAAQAMLRLVDTALIGESGTDWDAELAKLEEKRQHG